MRKVLVPVAIAALALGVWLSTKEPSPDSAVAVPASVIAPVPPLPDSQSITALEETQPVVAAEAVKATRDQPPPIFRVVYQEAEFRNGLVAYLVENGLAASDSERIADQAVEGLVDCALTHGWNTEERRLAASRCEEGVLQQAGLNETIRRAALDSVLRRNEAARNIGRSRATEAIPEPRAPQAPQ